MQAGDRIGAYSLVRELGAGGMGVVWRAHDDRLGRDVALKILPLHLAGHPSALMRFEREARGLASLSHPGIVSIFDLGAEGDLRYLVTELLHGQTLRDELRQGPLPWRRAAEIGATIAESLSAAHAKGIIHRDLKPENVFITTEGRVKILDFGLAKEMALSSSSTETTQAHQTEPGAVMGTLGYVSPEQLRGEEADFASDVFSLGCILYEMLSGRSAFLRSNAADTIAAILTAEPAPFTMASDVPPELLRIVNDCLIKDRRARIQSVRVLGADLANLAALRSTQPHPLPAPAPARWTLRPSIILLILPLLLGAAATLLLMRRPAVTPPVPAQAGPSMSLVVLPFDAPPDQLYAGEGLADSVFRRLATIDGLDVRPSKSIPSTGLAGMAAGKQVLRGTLRTAGANSMVDAEIVEARTGNRLWHGQFAGRAEDLLGIEQRLSADVERFVRRATGAEPRRDSTRAATVDREAYREYLRGRHHWNKFTREGFETALHHFENSIDLDPTYALAHAGRADAFAMLGFYRMAPDDVMPKARAAALRAIDLDPLLAEGYTSLGVVLVVHEWKWAEGEAALRKGVELNPRSSYAHHVWAVFLGLVGRSDEALHHIALANELDPLSMVIYLDLAWIHYSRNEIDLAIETVQKAVRHDPRAPLSRYELAWYLNFAERYAEALDSYEAGLRLQKQDTATMDLMREALRKGKSDYLAQQLALSQAGGEPHTTLAAILVQMGKHKAALDELDLALAKRERDLIYLQASPSYAALRNEPRFATLVEKVGIPKR